MLARIHKAMEEREEGFTLIELLVVIIIIGILAAIAIPVFLNQRKKGWDSQAKSDLRNMATAEETYLTDNDHYTATVGDLTATSVGFKQTSGVKVGITADPSTAGSTFGTKGYCLVALSKSGNGWYYDSEDGGLKGQATSADATANTVTVPAGVACAAGAISVS
jgi:type IV pilus assembly protein PilA